MRMSSTSYSLSDRGLTDSTFSPLTIFLSVMVYMQDPGGTQRDKWYQWQMYMQYKHVCHSFNLYTCPYTWQVGASQSSQKIPCLSCLYLLRFDFLYHMLFWLYDYLGSLPQCFAFLYSIPHINQCIPHRRRSWSGWSGFSQTTFCNLMIFIIGEREQPKLLQRGDTTHTLRSF